MMISSAWEAGTAWSHLCACGNQILCRTGSVHSQFVGSSSMWRDMWAADTPALLFMTCQISLGLAAVKALSMCSLWGFCWHILTQSEMAQAAFVVFFFRDEGRRQHTVSHRQTPMGEKEWPRTKTQSLHITGTHVVLYGKLPTPPVIHVRLSPAP